jgi:signal transduction histidine kinase
LKSTGTDEIGALKRELNAMCDRLEAAYTRIQEESTARVETLEQLRHLDRLRTVGTIASSIAHELGTPLNVLLLRGLSLADGEVDSQEVKEAGQAVVLQVEKMSRIVRQLLAFARARTATKEASRRIDLVAVAKHAASLLSTLASKHGVEVVVDARDDVHVRGDFGQLEQALTNLITNGIQAMDDAGGRLVVRVGSEGKTASIEVEDEGKGMSAEVIERAFEPFFTTKPDAGGTGLGLHVARGIVEDHGGTMSVRSSPGTGTTFQLTLPVIA